MIKTEKQKELKQVINYFLENSNEYFKERKISFCVFQLSSEMIAVEWLNAIALLIAS